MIKVILKKSEDLFEVHLSNDVVIDYNSVTKLFECAKKGINGDKKCVVKMNYHDVTTEDVNEYVKRLIEELIVKDNFLPVLAILLL